jgi:hypothetical protein
MVPNLFKILKFRMFFIINLLLQPAQRTYFQKIRYFIVCITICSNIKFVYNI